MHQNRRKAGTSVVVLAALGLPLMSFGQGGTTLKGAYPTSHGILKSISGSELFVEVDNEHEMKFRMTRKTKLYTQSKDGQGKNVAKEIKPSSLMPGQTVDIDMQSSLDGSFEAVRITVLSPGLTSPK